MRSKARARKLPKSDGDLVSDMYEPDGDLLAGESAEDEAEDGAMSPVPVGPPSPFTPKEGSPYAAPVYIPEDIPIPPDFELRESSVPGAGLGVWAKKRMDVGDRLGPYVVAAPRAALKDTDFGWEPVLVDAEDMVHDSHIGKLPEDLGSAKFSADMGAAGASSWLKYIRAACSCGDQNLSVCRTNEQIYYKVIKDIGPGEELLVHVKDSVCALGAVPPSPDEAPTFRCDACDELFPAKLDLRRHQKLACGVGSTLFPGLGPRLQPDRLGAAPGDGQPHECKDCERLFPNKYSLEQHMVVHTEEREYKCDQCPKAFNWKSNLIRHQMSHDSGKRFECENCVKVFTDPSNLQRHIRSQHVGARAHACPDCGKTFATSSGLKQHKHIHSTVKPFICEVCHKSYTQFSNLCRHKRMHADCRTQIKCKDCGQMFSTTSSLNKHRRFCEGKSHYAPGGLFGPGLPLTPSPLLDKAKPQPSLNHAGLGFGEYFPTRPHPGGLPFSTAPPSYPALTPGYPGLFPPSLYPRPPLLPPTPLLKSPLTHTQDAKLPSPLGHPALPLVSAVGHGQGTPGAAGPEDKFEGGLEDTFSEKLQARGSDLSDGSDFEDLNTTTGTDLDTSSGSGSDLDSDADSDRDRAKAQSRAAEGKAELGGGVAPPGTPGSTAGDVPVFYSQHAAAAFFPPPDEQLLGAAGAAGDSIKAIASIAEKYFGPGLMGVPEKLGALPYRPVFPFQLLPSFPPGLCPFSDRTLAHNLLVKAEPKSPRDPLKAGGPSTESPFDLTTKPKDAKLVPAAPRGPATPAAPEEQPLDLSVGSRARASQDGGGRTPRKNHVYGDRRPGAGEGLPAMCLGQLPAQPSLHYAKPSPFFMDPIYRVEKRKVADPVGALKEKYLRPGPLLLHPQMSAMETMTEKLESFAALKDAGSSLQSLSHHPFGFRSPPPTLSDPILRKGKERYTCRYCGKIFPRSANLTRHLRTHTGEQPYRCKYCDRSFSISSNLQRHVRNIHNKEKPFKCHLCNRCFGQQTNLDRHLKKHEHEHAPVTQHAGVLANHLGTGASSPTSEPDTHALLDEKEDAYFSEIRNFIANNDADPAAAPTEQRPEAQDCDGVAQCPGLVVGKPEDVEEEEEEEEEELEEEDEDSLAGKSQEDAVSPAPRPQGAAEDDEDDEDGDSPATLAVGFGHARRCAEQSPGGLLALEPMRTFGKGLDLRRAAEEAFEVKEVLNATLGSETLKQTLYRQAKKQAYAMMLTLSEDASLRAASHSPLDSWLNITGATPESGALNPMNHL